MSRKRRDSGENMEDPTRPAVSGMPPATNYMTMMRFNTITEGKIGSPAAGDPFT